MAIQYYGIDKGSTQQSGGVATGSSTTSKKLELAVDLSASMSKNEVINQLEEIKKEIFKSKWPPA